ncbi:unnamed protein product [Paramecium octaurelia]|uniref:Dynein heavy chain, cytoplasmic n=1 Tax=Paramecium octaurelia TaxID=43137 RepID=A0A8S1S6L1_PAROT|nr:unnamed protein product [Paramecium octaurelia]
MEESETQQNVKVQEQGKLYSANEIENFNQYLSAICLSLLIIDKDQWNVACHEDVNQQNICQFLSDSQIKALIVSKTVENEKFNIQIRSEYEASNNYAHTICFLKRHTFQYDNQLQPQQFSNHVQVINVGYAESQGGANPFTLSHNYVQNCFIPIFTQYKGEIDKKRIVDQSSYNDLIKKLNEVNLAFIKCRQNVEVPEIILQFDPRIKEAVKQRGGKPTIEDAAQLNKPDIVQSISQTVTRWISDINQISNTKLELTNASIVDEINYWMSMERSLFFIENQLKQPEVDFTIEVLTQAKKMNITAQFKEIALKQSLQKCQSCNQFMKEFPINNLLIATNLVEIKDAMIQIFQHMKKLSNIQETYTIPRSLQLAESFSRELTNEMIKYFKGFQILHIKYVDFKGLIIKTQEIFSQWDEEYKIFKQSIVKKSVHQKDQYGQFEHIKLQKQIQHIQRLREMHENLKEVIEQIIQNDQEEQKENVQQFATLQEIQQAYDIFKNVEVFDLSRDGEDQFFRALKQYEIAIESVEATITTNLRDSLGSASSAKEMFRILAKFNKLFSRPRIKGAIQEYQSQLLKTVHKDIQSLQNKFKETYQKSQNSRLASARDIPLTSGFVIWSKQLQIRLQKYMQKVEQILGPQWAEDTDGKKCKEMGETFERILDSGPALEEWKQEINQHNKAVSQNEKLFEVVTRRRGLEIRVNYEKKLSQLFKEVRNLSNMKTKVPYSISHIANDAKASYPFALSLQESLHTYIQITSQLNAKSAKLVAALRKEVQLQIGQGFNYLWTHKTQLQPYVKKFTDKVFELEQAVNGLNERIGQIESLCEAMKTCPVDSLSDKLKDIQEVIDSLCFNNFSNLHIWIQDIDKQIESILCDRVTVQMKEWLNQFINYQKIQERGLVNQTVVHELKLQDQIIYVDPPVEYAKYFWFQEFHKMIGQICSLPRLVANRFDNTIQQNTGPWGTQRDLDYSTTINKINQQLIKDAYSQIGQLLEDMEQYVQTWLNYQSLWELDIKQVEQILQDDIEKWQQMLTDIKQGRATFDNSTTEEHFGAIIIDYRMVQVKINHKYDAWHKELLNHFGNKFGEQLRVFNKNVTTEKEKLLKINFQDLTSDIIESITIIQEQDKKFPGWSADIESFKNGQKVLDRQRYQYPGDWLSFEQVEMQWNQFKQIRSKKLQQQENEMNNIQSKIQQDERYLNQQIQEIEEQWKSSKPDSGDCSPNEAEQILKSLNEQLLSVQEKYEKCSQAKEILKMDPPTHQQKLNVLLESISDLQDVWQELGKIWKVMQSIKEQLISALQNKKIKDTCDEAQKQLNGVSTKTRNYDAFEKMKEKVKNYIKMNKLIMDLKDESMKERHWRQLLSKLKINESLNQLQMQHLWNANLLNYENLAKDIMTVARGEQVLETMISQVKDFWNSFELELVKYQTKCKLIKGWDELFQKLEEDLNNLASMKISPFYKTFEAEISQWDDKLQKVKLTMDIWIDVQRRWVYLEGIFFGSSDIKTQLQNEYNKFKDIDSQFTNLMKKVAQKPQLMDVQGIPNLAKTLERLSDFLQKIQKALGDYLETQRQAFARFYFVGDDDLLDIIGNSKDVTNVQRHFPKMYAGIVQLQSRKDGNDDVVLGMSSKEGEVVPFSKEVKIAEDPRINIWLGKVDNEMMNSLALDLEKSVLDIQANQQNRMKVIEEHPAQIILLALQVGWCFSVESSFNNEQQMKQTLQYVLEFLSELAESVLKDHPKQLRQKFEQIITDFVHQRDVIRLLMNNKINNKNDFGWQYHMRFNWNSKEADPGKRLLIQMGNAQFHYGFEYLGVAEKLVQTPLTDKCFLTLTQALHLRMGGSPFGPAGTGKTESVKALGAQLGRFVLVFNCDETFDFNAMGRIFVGLCQVGAWGCFDEFNRLEERMLSACSQQILLIQTGLREKQKQIELMGKDVKLSSQMGVFVTMNPGYAGRSNLPENLKQLFRQMAMVKPDRELIAQVMLFSQGFRTAEKLAGKIVSLFELCDNQLSSQPHYDFGLRALKSVLNSAGNMKRQEMIDRKQEPVPQSEIEEFEQTILLRSVCDTVVPKLIKDDIKLLETLLQGVFPGSCIPEIKEEQLRKELALACQRKNLQSSKNFIEKVLQLFQIQRLQHGLMLVGPCGCGKSAAWRVLLEAMYKCDKVKGEFYIVDPKAISKDELYGRLDNTTLEWTDGVFTSILRKIISNQRQESTRRHWIIFDGDVDPEWAENLNSVLDDNKLLTLPNGERLAIPPNVRMIFEVETLKYATLATVSRCGMVWFSEETINDENIFYHFLERLKQDDYDQQKSEDDNNKQVNTQESELRTKCVKALESIIKFLSQFLQIAQKPEYKHVMEFTRIRVLESTFALVRRSISNIIEYNENNSEVPLEDDQITDYMVKQFLIAVMWGVAGSMNLYQRTLFSKEICQLLPHNVILPQFNDSAPSLIDFEVTLPEAQWSQYKKKVPQIEIDPQRVTDADLIIETVDTLRHKDVLCGWLNEHRPFLLCGPPGSGKTMTLMSTLKALTDFEMIFINFSSSTMPQLIIKQFDHYCEYKKTTNGVFLQPKNQKWLVVFCDEINLPDQDKYGTMAIITFLRQLTEQHGFWRSSDRQWISLDRIQFVGACNPPTDVGRKPLTPRFLRHCPLILVDFPGPESLKQIYGTFNKAMLRRTVNLKQYSEQLTNAMVEFYTKSQQHFTADQQAHYIYSPRELTRWKYALNEALEPLESVEDLVRLWAHEGLRLFQDRLVHEHEKEWCNKLIDQVAYNNFNNLKDEALQRPILFSNYLHKVYQSVDREELRKYIQGRLKQFNEEELSVPLVVFDDVLDHILRIDRVLKQPLGHLLLVGSSGVGKTTLTRFVSWINNLTVFQIKAGRDYQLADFDNDLREVMKRAGAKGEKITFIFDESNVLGPSFLEKMNALLASGEIPGLFENDEYLALINLLKENSNQNKQFDSSEEQLFKNFTYQVQRNLHVVFTMNPKNPDFSNRTASSPALFNRCVIDWFGDWTNEALFQVGKAFTMYIDPPENAFSKKIKDETQRQHILVSTLVYIQNTIIELNNKLQKGAKRFNYITPRDYLDFLKHFEKLHNEKKSQLEDQQLHLNVGLDKLKETEQQVLEMQKSLDQKKIELQTKERQAGEKLQTIIEEKKIAEKKKEDSTRLSSDAEKKAKEMEVRQSQVNKELNEALPALENAKQCVNSIKKDDLNQIRALGSPPALVKLTMEAVVCAINSLEKSPEWKDVQKSMANMNFINNVINFNTETMPAKVKKFILTKYLSAQEWNIDRINFASKAAGPLAMWLDSQLKYADILQKVDPLRQEVAKLLQESDELNIQKKIYDDEVAAAEAKIHNLQQEYSELISQKESIKSEMLKVQEKVTRSQALLSDLSGERVRWEEASQNFKSQLATMIGDVLLSSAFLSYIGFFDHFYRKVVLNTWKDYLQAQANISYRQDLSLIEFLSRPSDRLNWQSHTLPSDDLCMENAIILYRFQRYPLVIDPSGQALSYISSLYKDKKLARTSFTDESFLKTLETCLRFGCPLLVQDVEKVDPILNSVLNNETYKTGGRVLIRVGNQEIDFSQGFTMFMITRDSTARFTPDLCSRVTFVNFTVTQSSLQEQCLNIFLRNESPETEEKRLNLMKLQGEYIVKLRELEDQLLDSLNNSRGSILEDEKVIQTLEKLKKEAAVIVQEMKQADTIMNEVMNTTHSYVPLANTTSKIFFSLTSLANIHYLYQFSLQFFMDTIYNVLNKNEQLQKIPKQDLIKRRILIFNEMFKEIYKRMNFSLLQEDKLVFAITLAQVKLGDNTLGQEFLNVFKPPTVMETTFSNTFLQGKLSIQQLKQLEGITQQNQTFNRLIDNLNKNEDRWLNFLNDEAPENDIPTQWYNEVQRDDIVKLDWIDSHQLKRQLDDLHILRIFRADRFQIIARKLINQILGDGFMDEQTVDMKLVVEKEASNKIPILLCSAPGFDPSFKVEQLSREMGIKLTSVAIGSAEGFDQAEQAITQSVKSGSWVMLKNVHLATSWLNDLEKKLFRLTPNVNFRIFLTMEFNPKIPTTLIRQSYKLVFEPPDGIKASLIRTFKTVLSQQRTDRQPVERARLHFLLAWLHAVILERLRFTPIGWSKTYEFNEADQRCSLDLIDEYVDALGIRQNIDPSKLPWDAFRTILTQNLYGGKVDNEYDQKILQSLVEQFFTEQSFNHNHPLFFTLEGKEAITVPEGRTYLDFMQWIEQLPKTESPEWSGLPSNVERVQRDQLTQKLITKVQNLQQEGEEEITQIEVQTEKTQKKDNKKSDQVQWLQDLLEKVEKFKAILPTKISPLERTADSINDPLFRFLDREITVASKLLKSVRQNIEELIQLAQGKILATNVLRQLAKDVFNNIIPAQWNKYNVITMPLNDWVGDFKRRIDQFDLLGKTKDFQKGQVWFGGLLFPEAYLTATRQYVAQANKWSLEELELQIIPEDQGIDEDSFVIEGVSMEGGHLDSKTLQVRIVNEISVALKPMTLKWCKTAQKGVVGDDEIVLPVYLNKTRKNLIFSLKVKMGKLNRYTLYQKGLSFILFN